MQWTTSIFYTAFFIFWLQSRTVALALFVDDNSCSSFQLVLLGRRQNKLSVPHSPRVNSEASGEIRTGVFKSSGSFSIKRGEVLHRFFESLTYSGYLIATLEPIRNEQCCVVLCHTSQRDYRRKGQWWRHGYKQHCQRRSERGNETAVNDQTSCWPARSN